MTAPITPRERAALPDILRGLAIGGILIVNLQNFAGYIPWQQSGLDAAAQTFIDFTANGKFVSTFAMLFGAGAALFVTRAGQNRMLRRLVALLAIGLIHGTLIWSGDILTNYAIVAFALIPLLLLPRAAHLTATPILLAITALQITLLALVTGDLPASPDIVGVDPVYRSDSYLIILKARASDFLLNLGITVTFYGPWLLGLFLIGARVAQSGILQHPERHIRTLKITAVTALLIGLPLNLTFLHYSDTPTYDAQLWAILLRFTGGLAFAFLYAALIALLVAAGRATWLRPFANVGRLALSNYLLDSIILTLVFNGYGLGLYGQVGALTALIIGVTLFAGQIVLSGWYLKRYRVGPAEWVLRRLTYGKGA